MFCSRLIEVRFGFQTRDAKHNDPNRLSFMHPQDSGDSLKCAKILMLILGELIMKPVLLVLWTLFAVLPTASMAACPQGYYNCGGNLCCPR